MRSLISFKRQKGISYQNGVAPSYANNWNFGQPCYERPDHYLLSEHPDKKKYPNGVRLRFGQWIALQDDPDWREIRTKDNQKLIGPRYEAGDILTDQKERARLRREQRELFDKFMREVFSEPSALQKSNRDHKTHDCSRPFWMDRPIPSISKKAVKS